MKHTILLLLLFPFLVNSQSLRMYEMGGGAGVNALQFNPSMMAGSKYAWHFNLGTMHLQTSAEAINNSFVPFSSTKIKGKSGDIRSAQTTILGPSFMYQTPKIGSFAIATKYTTLQKGAFSDSPSLAYNSFAYSTLSLSYAYQYTYKAHALAVGASYLSHKNYAATAANFSQNGNFNLTSNQYPQAFKIGNIFKGETGSTGLDFGFNYEYRPKHSDFAYMMDGKSYYNNAVNKYALRFAMSFVGAGSGQIFTKGNYKNFNKSLTVADRKNLFLKEELFKNIDKLNLENPTETTNSIVAFSPMLNLNLEGALGKSGWYLGVVSSQPTKKSKVDLADFQQGFVGFYPKFEKTNDLEFAMPIVYQSSSKKLGLGLHFRIGALTFGSEGINGFFAKKAISPSFYFGINFGKILAKIKDRDGDAVSDKLDKCLDLAGVWAFKGCPDTDNDGIEDKLDKCPENAGPKETNGCPDADGDGIFDNLDACPKIAGLAKFNGCPDTDGDGIMDSEDDCPNQAGKLEDGGCPDTDGDGIIDSKDNCPTEKGTKENKGCPK